MAVTGRGDHGDQAGWPPRAATASAVAARGQERPTGASAVSPDHGRLAPMNGKATTTRTKLERGRSALGPALELVHTGRAPTRAVLTSELGVTRATAGAVAAEL